MKIDWSKYIGYIMFIAAVLGWAYDSGVKNGKLNTMRLRIEHLERDNDELKDFLKEQLTFNGEVTGILSTLAKPNSD